MHTSPRLRALAAATTAALVGSVIALVAPSAALAAPGALSISGNVVGGYIAAGNGVAVAYESVGGEWVAVASGDIADDGDYLISGLGAGTYRVSFTDTAGFGSDGEGNEYRGWKEWWNDETTEADATDVVVSTDPVTGIDADLDTVDGVYSWPTITGTHKVGQTLTVSPGVWPASVTTFEYDWYADDDYIAASKTLKLTNAHAGKQISVLVWGRMSPGQWSGKDSGYYDMVTGGVLTAPTPTISGTVAVGSKLTAKPGTWTPQTKLSYQWYASGKAVSGATKSTFTLTSSQKAKSITVKVTGKKTGFTTVVKTAKTTAKVATAATPKITGSAKVGSKLTAKPGTWTSGTTFSYQWYANGKAISKATKSSFTVTRSQAGKALTVKVTGKKSGYATVSKTSKATAKVLASAKPTISGAVKVAETVKAKPGSWTSGTAYSYQWYANGKAIKSATRSSYTISASVVGKKLTVTVTGKKSGYASVSRTSSSTRSVTYPSSTAPVSKWDCPSWAPIKGNQSGIYHTPRSRWYEVTTPEECFRTESAARAAGYRAPRG
jgi:hypothetical protein